MVEPDTIRSKLLMQMDGQPEESEPHNDFHASRG